MMVAASLGQGLIALFTVVLGSLLAWLVGAQVSYFWDERRRRRESDLATLATFLPTLRGVLRDVEAVGLAQNGLESRLRRPDALLRPRRALSAPVGSPAAFCTNGSATASRGITFLIFGPGDPSLAQADEYVELADLEEGRAGFAALALSVWDLVARANEDSGLPR
jgi:hypothetical protein